MVGMNWDSGISGKELYVGGGLGRFSAKGIYHLVRKTLSCSELPSREKERILESICLTLNTFENFSLENKLDGLFGSTGALTKIMEKYQEASPLLATILEQSSPNVREANLSTRRNIKTAFEKLENEIRLLLIKVDKLERTYAKAFKLGTCEGFDLEEFAKRIRGDFLFGYDFEIEYQTCTNKELYLALFLGIDRDRVGMVRIAIAELLRRHYLEFSIFLKMYGAEETTSKNKELLEELLEPEPLEPKATPPPLEYIPQLQPNAPSFLA